MTSNRKIVQISLIFISLFLIFATYFFYPKIVKEKLAAKDTMENFDIKTKDKETNTFENVEYTGIYDIDKPFTVQSEKAHILEESPNVVYMNTMRVTLYMSDGRIVVITSDKGNYNKITYDCFFQKNVKAEDGETVITSENLDLMSSEDFATIYNDVFVTSKNGMLKADQVNYDFKTRRYRVSMFTEEKVKVKLIEWIILKNLEL